jgi:hypothetical protein
MPALRHAQVLRLGDLSADRKQLAFLCFPLKLPSERIRDRSVRPRKKVYRRNRSQSVSWTRSAGKRGAQFKRSTRRNDPGNFACRLRPVSPQDVEPAHFVLQSGKRFRPPPLGVKQRLVKLVTTWSHIGSNFTKVFRHIAVAASSYGFPFSSLGRWEVTLLKTNSRSTFEKAVEAVAAKPLNKTSEAPRSEAG